MIGLISCHCYHVLYHISCQQKWQLLQVFGAEHGGRHICGESSPAFLNMFHRRLCLNGLVSSFRFGEERWFHLCRQNENEQSGMDSQCLHLLWQIWYFWTILRNQSLERRCIHVKKIKWYFFPPRYSKIELTTNVVSDPLL